MKLLQRLSNLLRSNLNSAIDKVSDPAKEIDLLVTDMEEEIKQGRLALRDQLAQAKLAQKKVDEAGRNVARWQEHAERAVVAGDDELAKEALRRLAEAERTLASCEEVYAEHDRNVQQMTQRLRENDRKLEEIKSRKETLKARARAAKQTLEPEGDAFARFDSLVDKIELEEQQIEAMAEINADSSLNKGRQLERDRETEERFARLLPAGEGDPKERALDERLRALKAKAGRVLPAKAETPQRVPVRMAEDKPSHPDLQDPHAAPDKDKA